MRFSCGQPPETRREQALMRARDKAAEARLGGWFIPLWPRRLGIKNGYYEWAWLEILWRSYPHAEVQEAFLVFDCHDIRDGRTVWKALGSIHSEGLSENCFRVHKGPPVYTKDHP